MKWFAFEIEKVLENNSYDCKFSDVSLLNVSIVKSNEVVFNDDFLLGRDYNAPDSNLHDDIIQNFRKKLRGKFIFQVFEKIFQERTGVKFKREQLFELVCRQVLGGNDFNKILVKKKLFIEDYLNEV